MGHQHSHGHTHPQSGQKGLTTAFWLNASFSVIEVVGGVVTNSSAILADAIHDMGDALSIGMGIMMEKVAGRKRDSRFSYGYRRFSLLSALILSLVLLAGACVMLVRAVPAFIRPQQVDSMGMIWLALLGLIMNGLAFFRIHRSGGGRQANSKAIMLHLLEDVLGWAAVLAGGIVIHFTGWYRIDPLLSAGIALFIIFNAVKNLTATMNVFLQAAPVHVDPNRLKEELLSIEGVGNVHDVHLWTLDGSYTVGTMHVVLEQETVPEQEGRQALKVIREKIEKVFSRYSIDHPTLQIEFPGDLCQFRNC